MNDLTKILNVSTRKERTNMKKVICCILLSVCLCTLLAGCGRDVANKEEGFCKIDNDDIYEFVDPETGVHYWIYSDSIGNSGQGGMTPRLNSDGTVMVTK